MLLTVGGGGNRSDATSEGGERRSRLIEGVAGGRPDGLRRGSRTCDTLLLVG